jgi:hypothetical protein
MATQMDRGELDLQEQLARIREMSSNSDKLHLETQKLMAESLKFEAERFKAGRESEFMPRNMIFQAMLATAALLGAGAAIAKLFFP